MAQSVILLCVSGLLILILLVQGDDATVEMVPVEMVPEMVPVADRQSNAGKKHEKEKNSPDDLKSEIQMVWLLEAL